MHHFFSYGILAVVDAGSNGQVESSYLQKLDLSRSAKDQYPLVLIKLMTRYGEDLVWSNDITKAEEVFNFIVTLTEGRSDSTESRKGRLILVTTIVTTIQYIPPQIVLLITHYRKTRATKLIKRMFALFRSLFCKTSTIIKTLDFKLL